MRSWLRSNDLILIGALLASGVANAAGEAKPGGGSLVVDRIVAVVDDQIILLSELNAASGPYEERAASEATDAIGRALAKKQVRQKVLDDIVAQRLVEEQARELGIGVSDREVDTEIARIKKENNLDDQAFLEQMRSQGVDEKGLRDLVKKNRMHQKVIEARVQPRVSISDAEVRAYYNENYKNDDEVHMRMISKKIPQAASDAETRRIRENVETLRTQVTTGGRDFAMVAKKETEGPNAENGGDLGWFKRGEISAEISEAAFALAVGEVSPVVSLGGAFHILQVTERKAAPAKPFAEVSDKIRGILFAKGAEKEFERWIGELRAKSFVEVRLDGPVQPAEEATPVPVASPKSTPKK